MRVQPERSAGDRPAVAVLSRSTGPRCGSCARRSTRSGSRRSPTGSWSSSTTRAGIRRSQSSSPRPLLTIRASHVVTLEENQGICGASNVGLESVRAPWLVLLDHDDFLEPQALAEVLDAAEREPLAEVIYSDRDAVDSRGVPTEVFAKPDWSPQRLAANMYVAHLTALATSAVRDVGWLPTASSTARRTTTWSCASPSGAVQSSTSPASSTTGGSYDLSTAKDASAKPYAAEAGRRAVVEHLDRTGLSGRSGTHPTRGPT